MPVENIIILSVIISAFAIFSAALAYADRVASRRPDANPAE
jgi:hypothetical protein